MLQERSNFAIVNLFSAQQTRPEIIVIFLAVLELMKVGELAVGREQSSNALWVYGRTES
jgi:segregation and condensation protein A